MERDLLLKGLVAEVLGPRGGPREALGPQEDPREEYLTGVLAPHRAASIETDAEADLPGESGAGADDQADPGAGVQSPAGTTVDHLVCPALDPRARPSSLGLSFALTHDTGSPTVDLCCTWARYGRDAEGKWQREPRGHLWSGVTITGSVPLRRTPPEDAGIEIQVRFRPEGNTRQVSVFLVNITPTQDGVPKTEEHVFQPQIRVHCHDGTTLVPLDEGRSATDDDDRELAMLIAIVHPLPAATSARPSGLTSIRSGHTPHCRHSAEPPSPGWMALRSSDLPRRHAFPRHTCAACMFRSCQFPHPSGNGIRPGRRWNSVPTSSPRRGIPEPCAPFSHL